MKYVEVGDTLEARWDGGSHVLVRRYGEEGYCIQLTRGTVLKLLGLFHEGGARLDSFALFDVFNGVRSWGRVALSLEWSAGDVVRDLSCRGFPFDASDREAVLSGWPSDKEFTLTWGEVVYSFARCT